VPVPVAGQPGQPPLLQLVTAHESRRRQAEHRGADDRLALVEDRFLGCRRIRHREGLGRDDQFGLRLGPVRGDDIPDRGNRGDRTETGEPASQR
jgi:hypothetical protein